MADENQPDQPGAAEEPPKAPPAEKKAVPPAKPAAAAHKPPPKKPAVMETTPWESDLTTLLRERFSDSITEFSTYVGQNFAVVKPEATVQIIEFLKDEAEFDYLVDVTAVDYPQRAERFDLVYVLYSFARNERIRVKTRIAADYQPQSVTGVHLGANWLEREAYDMFGIRFANHPDMKRILLPEDWEGYPLRKDYSIINMDNRWVKDNLGIESGQ
jgi:NADH-quinone oxidoreductase subunit C